MVDLKAFAAVVEGKGWVSGPADEESLREASLYRWGG